MGGVWATELTGHWRSRHRILHRACRWRGTGFRRRGCQCLETPSNRAGRGFPPAGGDVVVRAQALDHSVTLTVADTGPDIDAAQRRSLLSPGWKRKQALGRLWATSRPNHQHAAVATEPVVLRRRLGRTRVILDGLDLAYHDCVDVEGLSRV